MALRDEWNGFTGGHWVDDINVRDFIQRNYTAYDGDDSFLAGPTTRPTSSGARSRSFRQPSAPTTASSSVRPRSSLA